MADCHVHKVPTKGLVLQQVGVGNNESFSGETSHLHECKIEVRIHMYRPSLSKCRGYIVDSISHVSHHQHLFLTEITPLSLYSHSGSEQLSCLATLTHLRAAFDISSSGEALALNLSNNTINIVHPKWLTGT